MSPKNNWCCDQDIPKPDRDRLKNPILVFSSPSPFRVHRTRVVVQHMVRERFDKLPCPESLTDIFILPL